MISKAIMEHEVISSFSHAAICIYISIQRPQVQQIQHAES